MRPLLIVLLETEIPQISCKLICNASWIIATGLKKSLSLYWYWSSLQRLAINVFLIKLQLNIRYLKFTHWCPKLTYGMLQHLNTRTTTVKLNIKNKRNVSTQLDECLAMTFPFENVLDHACYLGNERWNSANSYDKLPKSMPRF